MSTGPFDTTTKTKIKTPYGTVLKVTTYEIDNIHPSVEYRTKPKCVICGEVSDCMCYQEDNDFTFEDAEGGLKIGLICGDPDCVIEYQRENDPVLFIELIKLHGTDPYELRDAIWESWGEWDDGPENCGV